MNDITDADLANADPANAEMANADMIEYWNGEAGGKWVQFQDRMDRILMPFGLKAMAAGNIEAGERILDIGCGCGDTSVELARRVGPEGRVLGMDISAPMLAKAKARAAAASAKNLAFEEGDAQIHRFAAPPFDLVFSRFGVMFFEDPVSAFANLRSALKPGGRLAFVAWQALKDNAWFSLPLSVIAKHVTLPEPPGPEDPGPFAFADRARLERILTNAGFTQVNIDKHDTELVGDALDEMVAFLLQMGPTGRAIAQSGADEATKARIAADLKEALAPYDSAQGVVLGAASWIVTARAPGNPV